MRVALVQELAGSTAWNCKNDTTQPRGVTGGGQGGAAGLLSG